jgi:carboxypeptidase Taq
MNAYTRLTERFDRRARLDEAAAMLGWDAAAMMPAGGATARGEQMATLAGLSHELLTAPELADDLAAATAPNDGPAAANLALMRDAVLRATALPRRLVEARAIACAKSEALWRTARPAGDFAAVKDALAEVFALTREAAGILGETLGVSPYDALMSQYQRGINASEAGTVFARYEAFLGKALPEAEARQAAQPPVALPEGTFPAEMQETLCRRLAAAAGLDFSQARLDRSAHPFCGGTPRDIRITTRYDEADPLSAITGVLHETGHALYEQNLPRDLARQPVGEAAGMAVHESQSLIVEMQAVRGDAYLGFLAPLLTDAFKTPFTVAGLTRRLRHVERSFIRVEADEMTYPAHVLLRFRLEQALLSGDLAVADLPGAWGEGLHALLGISPPNDRLGCLQDIHWYDGLVGYFPSYSLGAMAAAQLMHAARRDIPDLDADFAAGKLTRLTGWLTTHIHAQGAQRGYHELLQAATGERLNESYFEEHLTKRYLS